MFLDDAAPGTWRLKNGSTVEWPADTQAGNGNGGVAQIIQSTKNAIGYVDLPDAKASGLKFAAIKNAAGKYIEATAQSAQAAGEGVDVKDDLTFKSVNAKGEAAYPITMPTWCMIYVKPGKAKAAALKKYFEFMVGEGQKLVPEIDYAPLPKQLQEKAQAAVAKIET
jgi:phosphate transport system substrate-binding protein